MLKSTSNRDLLQFTTELLETVHPNEVAQLFIKKVQKLTYANGSSIVLLKNEKTLEVVKTIGYTSSQLKNWTQFEVDPKIPVAYSVQTKRAFFARTRKESAKKFPFFTNSNLSTQINAWATLPIVSRKKTLGAIGLSFKNEQLFTKERRTFLLTLAQQVAQALERATLYEAERTARNSSEIATEKLHFLSDATKILGSSLDYKKTLANVARIVVPRLADWCGIDILNDEDKLQNLVVVHQDPEKVKWAKILQKKYPSDLTSNSGVAGVMRTGKPELHTHITRDMLEKSARDQTHLEMLKSIGFKSIMIVPLKGQNKILGAISFIASESANNFTKEDLLFAEELAARAATAIDNAILYQKSLEGIKIRDEFLNIAAHELRTPLTSLQLQIQLLMTQTLNSSSRVQTDLLQKSLTTGEQQTKRLGNLINNLLDISRMTGKKIELEKDEVDLNYLIKDIIIRFDTTLKHTGTKVLLKNGIRIVGTWDKFRLDQVFTNILANAIKYGEGKPIYLSIKKTKNKALITIKDNGMGMTEDDMKKIFNRFVRTEAARKYGGLGLGLYISKQIIEAHSGKIIVQSVPRKGTEFTVQLPLNT